MLFVLVVQKLGIRGFLDIVGKLHTVPFVRRTSDGNFEWYQKAMTKILTGHDHFGVSAA
jgi:hypothetical protein